MIRLKLEASMFKKVLIAAGLATVLVWVLSAQSDLKSVVDKSMKAMGVENVKTLTITGEGGDGSVGQAFSPQFGPLALDRQQELGSLGRLRRERLARCSRSLGRGTCQPVRRCGNHLPGALADRPRSPSPRPTISITRFSLPCCLWAS